jgi:PHD/YefM family antitoxin component YafN of YafNO toxin-antitoxin module
MAQRALFGGLVIDEEGEPVDVTQVGDEAFYVINDDGFLRHVESEKIDRQVLEQMRELIQGHEDLISQGTMKMIGQDDIFTKAMIESSLRDLDAQFDRLINTGLPVEGRAWLGMLGFQVVVNVHGDVLRVEQPGGPEEPPE